MFTLARLCGTNALPRRLCMELCAGGKKVGNNLPIVLIVEDDFAIQIVVEEALSDAGFETAVAPSAEEAVTLLKSKVMD